MYDTDTRKMKSFAIRIILICLLFIFTASCEKAFFYPVKQLLYHPETCAAHPQDIVVETGAGSMLHGWYFKTPLKTHKGTIIFMHGNSNNVSMESVGMLWVLNEGYNLLVFDYRGYGISQGKPSIKGVLDDGLEFIDAFMKDESRDKKNIILFGQSLGGAVAAHAARYSPYADKFKVLVLESTFISWRDMAREAAKKMFFTWAFQYPVSWSFPKNLSTLDNIKNSKIKYTVILHSSVDKVVEYHNGETLFYAANVPKIFLTDDISPHAAIMTNQKVRKEFLEYIEKALKD